MVVAGLWVVACTALLLLARRDLQQGVDLLEKARDELGPADLTEDEGLALLHRAEQRFDSADSLIDLPVVAPMRLLPVVGRQVRSADALAGAAHEAVTIGTAAVEDARDLLDRHDGGGVERVRLARGLADVAAEARAGLAALDLGPRRALLGPLADARERFADEREDLVGSLGDAEVAARGLGDFLEGPSRYLVLAANNAEMRAGSGMFLSAGLLSAEDGHLSLADMDPTEELALDGEGVRLPPELDALWGWLHPGREWRQLGASPRFDVTGELAARMWKAGGHGDVDGVLALDVEALAAVLRVAGPIEVGGDTFDADGAVKELLHDQYVGVSYADDQDDRRERLGDLARATVDRLDAGQADPAELADALAEAARGRHVLAWARPRSQADAWTAAGVTGTFDDNSVLAAALNLGGNKLDQFLEVDGHVDVSDQDEGGDASVTLELVLRNQVPPGEPEYVAGPHPDIDAAPGTYTGVVSFSLPGAAQDLEIDGGDKIVASGTDGPSAVVATEVTIAAGAERKVTARFRLPRRVSTLMFEPSARVPSIEWSGPSDTWNDSDAQVIPMQIRQKSSESG